MISMTQKSFVICIRTQDKKQMMIQKHQKKNSGIAKLPSKLKEEVIKRLDNSICFSNEYTTDYDEKSFELDDLIKIYEYTKSTYPISTQHVIDIAISEVFASSPRPFGSDRKEKKSEILKTILSISQAYTPTNKSKKEIQSEFDKYICFRDDIKKSLTEVICVSKRKKKAPSVLLVGSPGVGKNYIAHAFGYILGKYTVTLP